jgi:hypothetical protein
MAGKTWDTDFRRDAVRESIGQIGDVKGTDLFAFPGSFCVPVGPRPIARWNPGKVMLVALVFGFLLLFAGAGIASVSEKQEEGPGSTLLLIVAGGCSLSGIAMMFLTIKCDRQILRWLIGQRAQALADYADRRPLLAAEIVNGDRTTMTISINGDDYGLILIDESGRRLMIEGTGARYQIRSGDVERLAPFQFMSYLGIEIVYRVSPDVRLHLAIARTSLMLEFIRQLPILFFMRGRIKNTLFDRIAPVLQSEATLKQPSIAATRNS